MGCFKSILGTMMAVGLLATITGCGGDSASSGSASSSDTSTPKAAMKTMAEAMRRGDTAVVKAVTINGDPKLIEMMTTMMASEKTLADAAVAKYGDAGTLAEGKMMADFDKELASAEVTETGDTATVKTKRGGPPLTLKKAGGEWKVDFAEAPSMPGKDELAQAEPMFNMMVNVNKQLASDIAAGKYKTLDEAKKAKQEKMMAATMGSMGSMKPPPPR